jgi:hypothetical protein
VDEEDYRGQTGALKVSPACGSHDERAQKLKTACTSMRRTATPVENGPP